MGSEGLRAVTLLNWSPLPLVSIQFDGIDKAQALHRICLPFAISMNECIAFGDNVNDVVLLRTAGCGVAVANAKQEAEDAADVILPLSNDEDAVAHAILH